MSIIMSSPKKTSPTASPKPASPRPLLRSFGSRKSSDLTNLATVNADLHRQISILQSDLSAQTSLTDAACQTAQRASDREARLKSLARKFWKDEWSGMKDYVSLFNSGEASRDIEEIEERVLREYRELFEEEREEKDSDRKKE